MKTSAKPDDLVRVPGPSGEPVWMSTTEVAFIELLRSLAAKIGKACRSLSPADRPRYLDKALAEVHDDFAAVDEDCAAAIVKSLRARVEDGWRH